MLSDADKQTLMDVNKAITDLFLKYNKNLLSATNSFELVVDNQADLAGIPAGIVATAATEAKERGKDGKWVFTLHAPQPSAGAQVCRFALSPREDVQGLHQPCIAGSL